MNAHKLKKMPVRTRVLLLLASLTLAFIGVACGLLDLDRHEAKVLSRHTQGERSMFYDRLLTLRAHPLKMMAFDNSYWDEMVTFVHTRDTVWGKQNIDTARVTFDADGSWVFDPNMNAIYGSVSSGAHHLKMLPFPRGAIRRILRQGPYSHFFLQTPDGLLELRSASIHGSSDVAHIGPARGYFLVGRLWDRDYLGELSGLTGARVRMLGTARQEETAQGMTGGGSRMRFLQACPGWDGAPLARLELVSDDPAAALLRRSAVREMTLLGTFSLLLLAAVSICLLRWVSLPLGRLSRALTAESQEPLTQLKADGAEFGTLARLMGDFFTQREALRSARDGLERRVAERTGELAEANQRLQAAYDATIEGWSRALDLRDNETRGHSQRVTDITLRLARTLGIADDDLLHIRRGALLHDIGKMGVPDRILLKSGPLDDDEWDTMRRHPLYALEMLHPIVFLHPALDIPYCYHEQWGGGGYPRGLQREDIPLSARIFAVVDVWDALRSDRPYRRAWPEERVRAHIHSLSGTHFDPEIVGAFLGMMETKTEYQIAA